MSGKCLALMLLFVVPAFAVGQETRTPLVVPLPEGGYVSFKSQAATASENRTSVSNLNLNSEFRSQALIDNNKVIHRVLVDGAGRFLFGYDLLITPDLAARKFRITVRPIDSEFESKLREQSANAPSGKVATLPKSAEPQVLEDGDALALDLLINQETGVKIVDVVKVSFDRSQLWDRPPATVPRDFTLDAVELRLKEHRLLVDGNLVSAGKPGSALAATLLWFYLEGKGRFIFSLVPREGYDFQKTGLIADNKIEFMWKGKRYELESSALVLSQEGLWSLWVLHDPTYTPFGPAEVTKDEVSRWEKWEAAIKGVRSRNPKDDTRTSHSNTPLEDVRPFQRFRVMVGGADRIENLWPKQ